MFRRVVKAASSSDVLARQQDSSLLAALRSFELLPGGRILATAGRDQGLSTWVNTFAIAALSDDVEQIEQRLAESAVTLLLGGGIGLNLTTVAPKIHHSDCQGHASPGPVELMKLWDAMSAAATSTHSRRGAMMAILRCDHPDIEEFIASKSKAHRLEHFNISVAVTDEFINALKHDEEWPLRWNGQTVKTIRSRALWESLALQNTGGSEPGIIFIDNVRRGNPLNYLEDAVCTNSCAEQPLPYDGSCPLASINLPSLVRNPFSANAFFDLDRLKALTYMGVRLLDNVIDKSPYPLERQRERALLTRRVGLGVTGLADALALIGMDYKTSDARKAVADLLRKFRYFAYDASSDLAVERGPFPSFDRTQHLPRLAAQGLEASLIDKIGDCGLRNGSLTCIAPAGSISILADNISSGIEPILAHQTERVVSGRGGKTAELFECESYTSKISRALSLHSGPLPGPPPVNAYEQMKMVATCQQYIDASISKTISCPNTITTSELSSLFLSAHEEGVKSLSVYVEGSVRGWVIRPAKEPASNA
jgi:ribonucleoside-diphosphate reductase alpha chain